MSDYKKGGLEPRYKIEKTNGEPINPNAKYFILRYDKDPHARVALLAYANSIALENPQLANQLIDDIAKFSN